MTTVQPPFGRHDHDSLQYHFRCGGLIGAARLFRTPTLQHASAWIWEAGTLTRLHDGQGPLGQSRDAALDVTDGAMAMRDGAEGVAIRLGGGIAIGLVPRRSWRWDDTISTVLHQPDMACTLTLGDRSLSGVGYCKRYAWTPAPRHWGYRFVQGWCDDGAALWTAEATFGTRKYDYFRLLEPGGALLEGGPEASRHRQDGVVCDVAGGVARVALEELAVWEAPLRSPGMDSLLRQRVCRLRIALPTGEREGLAINETCFGTLG